MHCAAVVLKLFFRENWPFFGSKKSTVFRSVSFWYMIIKWSKNWKQRKNKLKQKCLRKQNAVSACNFISSFTQKWLWGRYCNYTTYYMLLKANLVRILENICGKQIRAPSNTYNSTMKHIVTKTRKRRAPIIKYYIF